MPSYEIQGRTVTMPVDVRDAAAGTAIFDVEGVPHATPFSQGGRGSSMTLGGKGVTLELGDHPIAKELAQLGLPSPATMTTWTEHMRGRFGEAAPLR